MTTSITSVITLGTSPIRLAKRDEVFITLVPLRYLRIQEPTHHHEPVPFWVTCSVIQVVRQKLCETKRPLWVRHLLQRAPSDWSARRCLRPFSPSHRRAVSADNNQLRYSRREVCQGFIVNSILLKGSLRSLGMVANNKETKFTVPPWELFSWSHSSLLVNYKKSFDYETELQTPLLCYRALLSGNRSPSTPRHDFIHHTSFLTIYGSLQSSSFLASHFPSLTLAASIRDISSKSHRTSNSDEVSSQRQLWGWGAQLEKTSRR